MRRSVETSQIIAGFYEAAANPAIWTQTLDLLTNAFDLRGALLTTDRFVKGRVPHSGGMVDVLAQFFEEGWHQRDLRTQAAQSKPMVGTFFADQQILSREQIERSDYYQGFARSAGVPWFSAALLSFEGGNSFIALSLQRTQAQGMFSRTEMAAMGRLLPELVNATAFAKSLAGLHARSLLEGLQLLGEPAFLLSPNGKVVTYNTAASQIVELGISIVNGRLRVPSSQDNEALAGLIDRACDGHASRTAEIQGPIGINTGKMRFIVRAAPIHRSGAEIFGFSGAILMMRPLEQQHAPLPVELLRKSFGLTMREAEVAIRIGQDDTLEEIADKFGVTREAIRFHLKSIFAKTDTHRRSQLVTLYARMQKGG